MRDAQAYAALLISLINLVYVVNKKAFDNAKFVNLDVHMLFCDPGNRAESCAAHPQVSSGAQLDAIAYEKFGQFVVCCVVHVLTPILECLVYVSVEILNYFDYQRMHTKWYTRDERRYAQPP